MTKKQKLNQARQECYHEGLDTNHLHSYDVHLDKIENCIQKESELDIACNIMSYIREYCDHGAYPLTEYTRTHHVEQYVRQYLSNCDIV